MKVSKSFLVIIIAVLILYIAFQSYLVEGYDRMALKLLKLVDHLWKNGLS